MAVATATATKTPKADNTFALNEAQFEFVHDDEHKFCAYIGGLGAGKSFAGALKSLRYMVNHPGSLGMIGAPTYPQLRDSTLRVVREVFPPQLIADLNKHDGVLTLTNGSEALLRSMTDPDDRRGPNLAWLWLDEGPLCGYYAWKVSKGRLRQAGYPPQAWITGTPHGEDEFFIDFEEDPKPNHALYRASTRDNAVNLPPGYIEDLGYTGQFALQEIEGLFVNFEGLVYELRKEWHIGEWSQTDSLGRTRRPALKVGGVDWGYTNPSVALPVYVDGDDRAYVVDEFYQSRVGLAGLKAACLEFSRRYGIETWYCGPDEPEHIDELNAAFKTEGLQAKALPADDDINPGIETVRKAMQMRGDDTVGLKLSAQCVNLRAEMRTYSYPSAGNGKRDPNEKPIKKMDHACDALRYALHTALGGKNRATHITSSWFEGIYDQPPSDIGGVTLLRRPL